MSSKIRNTALFLSLILSIYFMRQAHVSPSTFFRTRILRALQQQQQVSDAFCTDSNRGITFSASQTSSADSYRHSLSQTRGDNTLTSMIQRDEPDSTFGETYGKSFIPYLVPWFVFFVIGIVGCLIFLINWCCMTCPCTRNRVCHCCRVPKTPRFRNIFVILSLMFMIFTAGAGIAGIVFTAKFPKYANGSLCDIIVAIEKIRDGSQEEMWIGVGPGINSIDTLVDRTHKAVKDLSIFDVLFADYNQRLNDTENVLNGFYQANRGKTLSRILPGQTPDTYEPVYIQRLGPPTTSGTATNEVQTEIDTNRQNLSNSQAVFNDFRSQVEIDTDQVINDALEDRPTLVDTNDKLSSVLDEMYDHRSTINTVVDVIFGVLLGLFIANLAVSVLAIFSILLVCCGAKFFNKAIHLSWCLLGILMIIGWVAAGALFGASIVAAEECDAVNNALEDPIFFNQSFAKLATLIDIAPPDYEKTRNILFRCMHGNGELAEEFNLTNNLGVFEKIFGSVNVLYAASVESLNSLPEGLASNQIGLLTQFKQGTLPDSEQTVGDIWVLNNLTSSTENPCTSVNDHWELNSQNCAATVPNDVVFAADSAIGFRIPDPTCVGYNNWAATSRDIQNRYTDARFSGLGCTPITNAQAAITYINSLASNRRQSDALIDSLGQGIAALDTQYTDFTQELQKTPLALKGANATVTGIYNDLVDPQTGLIANTNCKFIVSAVQQVQDITCTGVGTLIFQTAITYIVMSFVSLFGTLCLFCLAKRFTVKLERKKSDPNLYRVK